MRKIYSVNLSQIKVHIFTLFILLLPGSLLFAQTVQTYNASTTFTVPVGVFSITIDAWGAGGGSGGAIGNAADQAGGGGGGGAFSQKTYAVIPGQVLTITVGAGGTAGTTAGTAGGTGGSSIVTGTGVNITALGGQGGGGAPTAGSAGAGGAGGLVGTGYDFVYAGGNGTAGLRTSSREVGGAGGGGAGNNGAGGNGTSTTAAANTVGGVGGAGNPNLAPYRGGAGASGVTTTGNLPGVAGNAPGGGAAGAATYTGARAGAVGGTGQVVLIYTQLTYRSQINSISFGTSPWCVGETRSVTVSVTNVGTATWTDAGQDINIGLKWDSDPDFGSPPGNIARQNAGNLAPGATRIYTFPIVTPVIAAGIDHLSSDVVYEGVAWFRGNTPTGIGPGNSMFVSPNITIVALPSTPTGTAAQSFCGINNPTVASLAATFTAGNTLKWYANSTGGSTLLSSTPLVNGTTYYASQANTSGCESTGRFAVTATVDNPAAPTSAGAQSFCTINTPTVANLTATGTALKWYTASTGGTALAPATALISGTYYASQTVSGCESATRLSVPVTVGNPAAPTSAGAQSFCTINTPTVADLTATGAGVKWYTTSTGGTVLSPATAISTGTYFASQTVSGCESATRLSVSVTVGNPAAPTGAAIQTFCTINSPILSDINITGTAIQWYTVSTGGVAIASTTSLVNGTTYYASQIVSGCESATRLSVTVTVGNPAQPTGAATQSFCAITTPTIADIVVTGTAVQWYTVSTGGTAIASSTPLGNGTTYYASQTLSSCESATRLGVAVTVGNPAAPTGAATQSFCAISTPTIADIVIAGTAVQWYTVSTGGSAIASSTALLNGTTYYASQTLSSCESATRFGVTVTIDNPSAPTGSASQSFCASSTPTVADLTATGFGIQWYAASSGGTALASTTALTDGTHYYASQTIAGCESIARFDVTAAVYIQVGITSGPTPLTQTICASYPATFTVVATGNIASYQWYLNGNPLTNNTNINGATTATLLIDQVSALDAGSYTVSVNGNAPCSNVLSTPATLIVNQTIFITGQPTAQTLCVGSDATFSVTATGTLLTYQWKKNGVNLIDGGNIAGATTTSLTLSNITAADAANYRVEVSDGSAGCPTALSANAALTVTPTSLGGTVGNSTAVCSGTNSGTLNLTGRLGNIVNWEFSIDGGGSWTTIANITTAQTYSNLTQTTIYRAVVKNGVCAPVNSIEATITVNPIPDAIATPSAQTICSGGTIASIVLTGAVPATAFNWTRNNPGVTGIATSGSGDISGALTNSTSAPITVTFTITPTATSCVGTSITATVLVNPTPVAIATPVSQTICTGNPITGIVLTSATSGTTYSWTRDNPAVTGTISNTGTGNIAGTLINSTTAPITVTFTIIPTANSCDGNPITATVLVNPTPDAIATPATQTICSGNAITTIGLTTNTTGVTTTYAWTRNNVGSVTGIAASGSGNISGTLTNTTFAPITVTFTITPTANGCVGIPIIAEVLVNPTANTIATPASQTVCSGTAITNIAITSATTGTTFTWTRNNAATVTGIATSGSGDISGSLTNTTASPITVTFTITPAANGCTGTSTTATVLVNPTPNAIATPSSQTKCSGIAITTIALTSTTTGTTYTWTRDNVAAVTGIAASGSGNISGTLTNTTFAPITVTFTIISTANGCAGIPITAEVLVNPTANTIATPASQTICSATAITDIAITSSTGGSTFTWTRNNTATVTGIAASGSGDISGSLTNTTANPITVTFTITPTANGCTGTPTNATVLVNPTPIAVATPSTQTKCSGVAITTIVLTSTTTGTTYTWTRDNVVSVTGIAATGNGNISGTLTNTTFAPITVTFTITPTANGCVGVPIIATVLVNPTPNAIATPSSQTICSGTAITAIALTTSATGVTTTYNWTRDNTVPVTGIAASGSGNISGTLTNTTSAPVTVTFTITPIANGCIGAPITATVLVNPTPNTVRTPASQTICSGSTITTIALTSTTSGATFTWTRNNTATVTGIAASGSGDISGSLINTTLAPITVTFTVTPSANGCNGSPVTATVLVNPTPNAIATPSSQTKCSGIAITTIALTTGATGVTTTYAWTRDNTVSVTGIAASGTGNISGTLTNTTAAPITVTFTITPTANTCSGSPITATVLVNPKPIAGNITGTATTVCIGNTITLTANPSGIAPFSYVWNSTNTAVATVTNAGVVTGIGTGTTNIRYTVTDANGCSSIISANYLITVTKPTANAITQASGISIVCVASTLNLTSNATGTAPLTYTWASSNNAIATVTNTGVVTGVAAGSANITYTVTDGNGCATTSAQYSITVSPIPTGTFSATETSGPVNNDRIICQGANVTFTAPAGYGSYIFKLNGSTILQSGTSNVYNSSSLINGASITVDVANASNCGATFGPIVITVNPLPTPTLIADKSTICPGETVTFTAGGGTNYSFKINGAGVQSGSSNTYTSTTLTNGASVTVDVTNADLCAATSLPVVITVNPTPSGTLAASATSICAGDNITFTFTPNIFSNYDFRVNGVSIASSAANTFSSTAITNTQVVSVVVTNTFGCSATFTSIPITVNPLPTGSIITTENSGTPNDDNICAGSNVIFTATSGFSNYNFYLKNTTTLLQGGASNVFSSTTLVTGDYVTVTVTNGIGCTNTFPQSGTITVVASPAGTLTASPVSPICAGENVIFTVTAGFDNYNFQVNGVTVQNGTSFTYPTTLLVNNDIVTVEVTNSNSCITTFNAITFTVNPLPTGIMVPVENSGITANDGIICTGATIVFTVPAGFTNYDFLLNGATIQSGTSNIYTTSSLVTGNTVQVAVTGAGGCIGLLNLVTVTVNPLPPVATISGNNSVCLNSTTTFTNTTMGGVWGSSNNAIATVNASGIVSGVSAGTTTIIYTITDAQGCNNTATKSITVNPPPFVAAITGNLNVCTDNFSQLDNATTGGIWSSANIGVATVDGSGLVYGVAPGTAIISYAYTDINGCTTTVTTNVSVQDLPTVAPITTTAASFDVCESGSIQLATTTVGGVWSTGDPGVATINSAGVVTGVSSGTVIITYSITTSCLQIATADQVITVNAPALATVVYNGGPFCTTSGNLSVTRTGTTGGTYTATGGLSINSSDGTITPGSTGGTYTITYTVAASGGCPVYTTTTTVTITTAPSATISYSSPICTSVATTSVTRTGTAGGTYTSTVGLTLNPSTGAITPTSSTGGLYTVTYTIPAANGCNAFVTTFDVTITTAPSGTIAYTGGPFCTSLASVANTGTVTPGGTFTSTSGLSINSTSGVIAPSTSTGGTYTVTYTILASGGCSIFTTTTSVTITNAPTAVAGTAIATCANSGAVNITAGSSATNQSSVLWTSNGTGVFANATSLTLATYNPSAADIAAGSRILTLTVIGNGNCPPVTSTKTITISAPPAPFIITPVSPSICLGDVQYLSATAASPTFGTLTFPSVTNNIAIPDNNANGALSNITVAGIPGGAIITGVSINFNITHTYDEELVINIKAPNGNRLNLVNQRGADGNNFTNTTINNISVNPIPANGAPFTNTYTPSAANGVGANFNVSNVNAFNSLTSIPNGTWTFSAEDVFGCRGSFFACLLGGGTYNTGTLNNWSITINYTIPNSPLLVAWSPTSGLYTDPGATIAYAGQGLSTVYAKPAAAGNVVYSARATNAANCNTDQTVTITVNPKPIVTISADYCLVPGKVRLTANSTPVATSYIWSNGATTQTIDVDVAGSFEVTAFGAGTCPGKAVINVANELVVNGDFEAGNTGFITEYTYTADVAGNTELYPEGWYGVGVSGQGYHDQFYGKDHTTTVQTGNFMLINGSTTPIGTPARQRIIWEQTVSVLPNTNYYFSAWAMNLNPASPAQLRFEVNGVQVGTIADLNIAPKPTSNGAVNINNWVRFYSNPTWTSGPTVTTAVIRIINLNPVAGGNDFGLDDISFGTLSTFLRLESAPGTDAQTVCRNAAITDIVYSAGNGDPAGPTVTGLPAGVSKVFAGYELTISGTPTAPPGVYTYTVTTTGCNPISLSGTITVQEQIITLSSGSSSPTVCDNAPVNIGFKLSGTATGANATGLPTGITLNISGTSATVTGTPAVVAGSYPYSITTTGTCAPATVTGTITVQSQTITLNSANNTQTVCINTPIANIQYTVSGTANGASAAGLPPGVTGTYNSGFFIISGTPVNPAVGSYNYTVTTSGPSCTPVIATGTINVTPGGNLSLTSGPATNPQTVCKGLAINNITYNVTDATGASATGLAAGLTGSYAAGVFTISGTVTANAGTYNYTVTTTGGCAPGTTSGSITVQAQSIGLTSGSASPSLCIGAPMATIVYTIGGTATGATVAGLPAGVSGSLSVNVYTISGTPSGPAGAFTYTITTTGSCSPVTSTGTITIQPSVVGGTLTSVSICSGTGGTLTLTGNSNTPVRWEYSTDGGTTWIPIANTTISQTYPALTSARQYRVVVGGGCGNVFSTIATVGIHNLWTGATSSDWYTASNWSDGLLPSMSCPAVIIPAVTLPNVYPILNSGTATINSLIINSTASLTVTGATMQISGTITNTGGTFDIANGTLDLNGTSAQNITGSMFAGNAIQNLTLSNTAGLTVTGSATNVLNITGTLAFGPVNNSTLNTGDHLVLRSTATATARVADITNNGANSGNSFNGQVSVERFYQPSRSWRLITAPLSSTGNIFNSWQAGAPSTYIPGKGMFVTGPNPTGATGNGLDFSGFNNYSMKTYNSLNNQYINVGNTITQDLSTNAATAANIGYFAFVRGDRRRSPDNTVFGNMNTTTLSSTGFLQTGQQTFNIPITAIAPTFALIGNPYASSVDYNRLSMTNVDADRFTVYDPSVGVGFFVYMERDPGDPTKFIPVTPNTSSLQRNDIQSSQAFFVQVITTGTAASVAFEEQDKTNNYNPALFRPVSPSTGKTPSLRIDLLRVDAGNTLIADGVLALYGEDYNDKIDIKDALKFTNVNENLGILRYKTPLAIERRPILKDNDTIFLQLTRTTQRSYRFELAPTNLDPLLTAFLEDSYTGKSTPLSVASATMHDFEITADAKSKLSNRFRIVFKQTAPPPVMSTTLKAFKVGDKIAVEWKVTNETNTAKYEFEKSSDGSVFVKVNTATATGANNNTTAYNWVDINPLSGNNYYRVRIIKSDGSFEYSEVVLVNMGQLISGIRIYPNPVTDGIIGAEFKNMPAGVYHTRLLNSIGQTVLSKIISHAPGTSMENIKPDYKLVSGIYQLEVTAPDKKITMVKVIIK